MQRKYLLNIQQISGVFHKHYFLGGISPLKRTPQTQFIQEDQFKINEIEEGEKMLDEYTERITEQTENGIESSNEFINDNNKRETPHNHKDGCESH